VTALPRCSDINLLGEGERVIDLEPRYLTVLSTLVLSGLIMKSRCSPRRNPYYLARRTRPVHGAMGNMISPQAH
jgi:hypothetical protein